MAGGPLVSAEIANSACVWIEGFSASMEICCSVEENVCGARNKRNSERLERGGGGERKGGRETDRQTDRQRTRTPKFYFARIIV